MYELRALLEGNAASRAATRIDAAALQSLHESCSRFETLVGGSDVTRLVAENALFHETILAAADSDRLADMVRQVVAMPLVYKSYIWYSPEQVAASYYSHRQLTNALSAATRAGPSSSCESTCTRRGTSSPSTWRRSRSRRFRRRPRQQRYHACAGLEAECGAGRLDGSDRLAGIRVIQLGTLLAGPFAGRLLGDLGAEVIKIEAPGEPDPIRDWGEARYRGRSLRGPGSRATRSACTLNLRLERGEELLLRLIEKADVVTENFRPGTLEKWNLGYER